MDDPTKDLIPRSAIEYCLRKETVSTNPDAYKAHEKFIAYMDDPEISQFGRWMHSNGFNCALTTIAVDLDKIPSVPPQTGQAEPLELQFEQVGTHIIKTCPTCHTPWRVPPTSEYLKIAKYPCCPCGQRIRWERRDG